MVLLVSFEQNKIQSFLFLYDGYIAGKVSYIKTIPQIFCVLIHRMELALVSGNRIMFFTYINVQRDISKSYESWTVLCFIPIYLWGI